MPSGTPSAKPKITEARPTWSDTRAPQMIRLKRSRPNSSVPRACRSTAPGPLSTASANCADGLNGARRGAPAAITIIDLELHDDAHLLELLLGQGQHLGIEEGLADEVVLDREAVRMPGLGQELLGLLGIVLGEGHRDVAEIAGRHAARRHAREAAWVHGLLDGLAVDGVHERRPAWYLSKALRTIFSRGECRSK